MALAHKGLDFNSVPTRFLEVPEVEGGVSKTVPVIRDGDHVVADSFAIALYLDEAYPDRPTLFGGEGGEAMARFIERWSQLTVHPYLGAAALMDIHDRQDDANTRLFPREPRDALRQAAGRGGGRPRRRAGRLPRRAGAVAQHAGLPAVHRRRVAAVCRLHRLWRASSGCASCRPTRLLADGDPVADWFERCLDLHGGLGRNVPAAA